MPAGSGSVAEPPPPHCIRSLPSPGSPHPPSFVPPVDKGAVAGWPALQKWRDDEYLAGALGDAQVTVALTPGGRADALEPAPPGVDAACVFALPAERRMALAAFFQLLAARDGPVAYLQYQNSSLTAEAPQLLADVAPELAWASQAFGELAAFEPWCHALSRGWANWGWRGAGPQGPRRMSRVGVLGAIALCRGPVHIDLPPPTCPPTCSPTWPPHLPPHPRPHTKLDRHAA